VLILIVRITIFCSIYLNNLFLKASLFFFILQCNLIRFAILLIRSGILNKIVFSIQHFTTDIFYVVSAIATKLFELFLL